jgi:proline iminopeptidase
MPTQPGISPARAEAEDTFPPRQHGYLNVGDGHRLYFERYGNPDGIPVLFVHGGPGAGFGESDKSFFDPEVFDVVLFDQRGAGRSKPFASLDANTTDHLVHDMERLLDFLAVERTMLFGGSWGSTLSLVYAIRHPERVTGMVLRGIFLGDAQSMEHFVGGGVSATFPEVWERFIGHIPEAHRDDPARYYLQQMQADDEQRRELFTYEWALYELSCIKLELPPTEVEGLLEHYSYRSLAPLEAHYMAHQCFVPDNYVLDHANVLAGIPTSIVHGRYDAICLARDAYRLHQSLRGSTLQFVCAGHSASEPAIARALRAELGNMAMRMRG